VARGHQQEAGASPSYDGQQATGPGYSVFAASEAVTAGLHARMANAPPWWRIDLASATVVALQAAQAA